MAAHVGADVLVAVGTVDVDDTGVAVVDADGQGFRKLAVDQFLVVEVAVPEDVRQAPVETELGDLQGLEFQVVGAVAARAEGVAVDEDASGYGSKLGWVALPE